uniref:Receptor-type tyrosine-protein phosphatase eta n=1 Tax=Melopsittacus undulatus TaxID=13146 RepID=A0A8C6N6Y9_MELUD
MFFPLPFTEPSPVLTLKAEHVGATSVSLSWTVNSTTSNSYTYRIEVVNDNSIMNLTSNVTEAEITELIPGTMYSFTVFAVPSPVLDLKAEYVGVTSVNLSWTVNDTASNSYMYRIEVVSGTSVMKLTSNATEAAIAELIPGTMYNFTVFAVTADGQTEGEGVSISLYTKPSPVLDLKAEYVGVTSVNLSWTVNDTASNSYMYRIEVVSGTSVMKLTSNATEAAIAELIPGTMYNFTVFAVTADGQTEGEGVSIMQYTSKEIMLLNCMNVQFVPNCAAFLLWVSNSALFVIVMFLCTRLLWTKITLTLLLSLENLAVADLFLISLSSLILVLPFTEPSPVLDLKAQYVGVTSVNLSWAVNDTASNSYTYRIEVVSGTSIMNLTSNITEAAIAKLIPGTMYSFTVFAVAADGQTEGEGVSISLYTKPSPVLDLKAEYVGVTSVNLSWAVNDTASNSYVYRIEVVSGTSVMNLTSNATEAAIAELIPGTMYNFTVFAVAADGQTEGEGVSISLYTSKSQFLAALFLVSFSVHGYTRNCFPHLPLQPCIFPDRMTEAKHWTCRHHNLCFHLEVSKGGESKSELLFFSVLLAHHWCRSFQGASEPSPVLDLKAEYVGVTSVNLSWAVNDTASNSYMYRIEVVNDTSIMNLTSSVTEAKIIELIPGTMYSFTVFAVAADGQTEGEGVSISLYTTPALVNSFQCEPVLKESSLMLKWECPPGNNSGFKIKIFNDTWEKEEQAPSCIGEGSAEIFTTPSLDYFSTYTVTIATLSNSSESDPVQKTCNTSITDPPPPSKAPLVKAVSHNSLSVEFSDFESVNGPLKAYAVMITTEEQGCGSLKSKLNNTYEDFKKKMTVTYVTYVIATEQAKSPFPSQNGTNIVNVGNGDKLCGYKNGPLTPLRSYRASVAGFTNITFNMDGIIVAEDSYVSFSPCSEAVLLPQDPGVIAGAIIGCLLAILAVVTIGGFIFWRRRRKDKRNTEVSFSPIKSKMIKVENFESYFKKQQADSNCGFAEEYEELKSAGVHQPKFAAELPENRGKNRYNNVLPYDISRVKLSDRNSASDDYINANYMPGYNSKKAFIAAQGPLPNTIEDFWCMIWEKNIYSIVMLTKCVEQARTKCEQYWPDKQPKSYGDIIVTMVSEIVLPEWTIRDFTVEKVTEGHTVRQFHFTSWPDHGVPETTELLINFRHLVHEYSSQNPVESPTLVHCSAGVGRTGTFIAIDRLIQQIEMENTVDVYGVVYDLRMHRPLMVQTEDQYVFLNQCVMDIIRSLKDRKTDLIYQNMTAMAIYENVTPGPGFGKANGYHT